MGNLVSMDAGWRFREGEQPVDFQRDDHASIYPQVMAGGILGPAGVLFDDNDWEQIDLPHDFAMRQKPDRDAMICQGYRPRGIAWYRKRFSMAEEAANKRLFLRFDGIATHADVYLNGMLLCVNRDGFTGFSAEITEMCFLGEQDNVLSVRVDATAFEGWWYEGAGIYRHVWLDMRPKAHILKDCVSIESYPVGGAMEHGFAAGPEEISEDWRLRVGARIDGCVHGRLRVVLEAACGTIVAEDIWKFEGEYSHTRFDAELTVRSPKLWTVDAPDLYTVRIILFPEDGEPDEVTFSAGFRTIGFSPDEGFFLNGLPMKLKGICCHQDHAGVGMAVPDSILEMRVRLLREMGANAYRCAHNCPSPEFLSVCDRLGMMVMIENRTFSSSPLALERVRRMALMARTHPCVIIYSLFNEEPWQNQRIGCRMADRMLNELRALDSHRPVTGAQCAGVLDLYSAGRILDICGFNYQIDKFDEFHARYPDKPILGTENGVTFATRGVAKTDWSGHVFGNFDEEVCSWGNSARETWRFVSARPFVLGQFSWSGFDYRGEPQPHRWPSISSHWGLMDTCGFKKDMFWLYKAFWRIESVLHLFPHWNFEAGKRVRVGLYTNCDRVVLYLNDQLIEDRAIEGEWQLSWEILFVPGILHAEGWRDGRLVARDELCTAGQPERLLIERMTRGEADHVLALGISMVDGRGVLVPDAEHELDLDVEGARVLGVGNGNPNDYSCDVTGRARLFSGRCQIIVRVEDGAMRLVARAKGGLEGAFVLKVTTDLIRSGDVV